MRITPEQKQQQEENAKRLIDAIKKLACNEYALENFESYLQRHFETWYKNYANTPDGLVYEFENFLIFSN